MPTDPPADDRDDEELADDERNERRHEDELVDNERMWRDEYER